jgi:hypothetical protein
MRITVTKKHIKRGRPSESDFCPIALALKSVGVKNPNVDADTIDGLRRGTNFTKSTPDKLARFIARFDDGNPVKPFSFDIALPA